jgi:soluble lytic murein transglycosylase-like protein
MRSNPPPDGCCGTAKGVFSELSDDAVKKGPQIGTRRSRSTSMNGKNRKPATPGTGQAFYSARARDSIFQLPRAAPVDRPSLRCLIDSLSDSQQCRSEMRKQKPHGAALAWLKRLSLSQGYFSEVTSGEIQKGVELTSLHDPAKAADIAAWAATA